MRPFALFAPAALGLALVLAGCSTSLSNHHVKSARAQIAAPVTIPALNLSNGEEKPVLGIRVSQSMKARGTVSTRTDTLASDSLEGAVVHNYFATPGNYSIEREEIVIGLDFQAMVNRVFDVFMTLEGAPTADGNISGVIGMGLTYPGSWLRARVAPAFSAHGHRLTVTDSIHEFIDHHDGGTTEIERVVHEDKRRLGLGAGGSLSLWIPETLTDLPFTPFIQMQYGVIWLQSETLPTKILWLETRTWTAGFDYETSWGHVQARVAQEEIGADGWSRALRAQTGVAFNLGR